MKQKAKEFEEELKLLTVGNFIKKIKEKGDLISLIESLQYMHKGNREAIIDGLAGATPKVHLIEQEELVDADIVEYIKGGSDNAQ